jgi:glycosyltransferase involved in cell wall biosynthesis
MRILYVTSEWPSKEYPVAGAFLRSQVSALQKAGIDIDVMSFRGRRKPTRYWHIYRQIQRKISHEHYDLAHAHFGNSGFLLSLPKRLPLVVTFHGSDLIGLYSDKGRYEYISLALRQAMKFVAYQADEVILVAQHLARYLNRKDYHVIPCGVDLSRFTPISRQEARDKLGLPAEEKFVVFVGNIHRAVKRYSLALDVMKVLARRHPDINAKLIPVFDVPHEDVPLYLGAANALLLTSKHEGSPTVIKEAMACNLPIVSTDVGDVRERLQNVTDCAIATTDTPEELAEHLAHILRQEKRTNGREIIQELDESNLAERNIEVYRAAISRNQSRNC